GEINAFLAPRGSAIHSEVKKEIAQLTLRGLFYDVTPILPIGTGDPKADLLTRLLSIHNKGWIASKRLNRSGDVVICPSLNCGGYTLEAEFGIRPNSRSEPDYRGWEIKQHNIGESFEILE